MKEGAAGSRGEEVAMEVDVVEERLEEVEGEGPSHRPEEEVEEWLEEVEEAGPSHGPEEEVEEEAGPSHVPEEEVEDHQVSQQQQATFQGMGRGAVMRHLILPPSIGKRGKCIVCVCFKILFQC